MEGVPAWDGEASGWNSYLEEVEWYVYSTQEKERNLCAPRLVRKLSGAAKNAVRGIKPQALDGRRGVTKLLQVLVKRIGELPIPDLAGRFDDFFFKLARRPYESMAEWGIRHMDVYDKLQHALQRVKEGKSVVPEILTSAAKGKGRGKGKTRERTGSQQAEEEEEDSESDSSVWSVVDEDGNTQEQKDKEEGFLPTELRGWLLLRNSGLDAGQRANVLGATRGELKFEVIYKQLRAQWGPQELTKLDQSRKGRAYGMELNDAIYDEGEEEDWDGAYGDDEVWYTTDEWQAWAAEAEDEDDEEGEYDDEVLAAESKAKEAEVAAIASKRTLAQAKAAVQKVRLSRGFGEPGRGGAKGQGKKFIKPSGGGGPCFCCGGPHQIKDCPDRTAPKGGKGKVKGKGKGKTKNKGGLGTANAAVGYVGTMLYVTSHGDETWEVVGEDDDIDGNRGLDAKFARGYLREQDYLEAGPDMEITANLLRWTVKRDPEVIEFHDMVLGTSAGSEEETPQAIYGLSLEHGLSVVDCGATETVGSPEACATLVAKVRADNPKAQVLINPEAGNGMRFKLANGDSAQPYSHITVETPHGWLGIWVIEAPGVPILTSIKTLRQMSAAIDFATGVMSYSITSPGGIKCHFERPLEQSPKGHLLWDPSDGHTGRVEE